MMITTLHKYKKSFWLLAVALLLLAGMALVATTALAASVTEDDKLIAADAAAGDIFGRSVAVSGSTVVVGAPFDADAGADSGSAYVFDCSSLPCIQVSKLTASDAVAGDQFGFSVALDGSTAVVGANLSGSAYVFDLSSCGAACTQSSKLTASDAAAVDFFGFSVAVSSSTAVVGAVLDDGAGTDSGSAYVFDLSSCGAACTQSSKLTASDAALSDLFGYSVALDGSTAVVGAPLDDDGGSLSGSAYVFDLSSCGAACTQSSKLTASDAAADDQFGFSVALDGSTVVVGAPFYPDAVADSGSAYVFDCGSLPCIQVSKLTASDAAADDYFGFSVALDGSTVVVGAPFYPDAVADSGSAYVFDCSSLPCIQVSKLTASDAAAGDQFGFSVALDGSTAVVGAVLDDGAGTDSGSAYVLDATPPSPLDDGGWELVAHMSNSGGMFDYHDSELAPAYSKGTFVPNPDPSTPDFQRVFPVVAGEILFITGDRSIWAIADYGDLRALIDAHGATQALNLDFEIGVNGVVSNTTGNVLSRAGVLEDPWISMEGNHGYGIANQRIVWGENNYNGSHVALKNNHGGINVYIKAANDSDGDGVPDDQDAFPNDPDRTVSCLAGYYGATSCIPAPLGTFVAADGALTADLCPLGTFSDQLASTACTAAPAGTFVDFVGAAAATACAPGSYQDLEGQTSCFEAPIGFYVPGTGSTAATACPAGSTTASTASTSLSDCVNEPPVVTAGVSYSGSEGSPIALNAATASDREGPIGSYSWTVDDTLCSFDDDSIVDPQLTCADNGTFAATLTVSDGYLSNSSTATVTVNNVDPTVTSLVVPWHEPIDIAEEALSSVDVTFFDPAGTNDNTYTCDFDLDYNGTTFASDASVSTSYGSCSTPLAYDSPGVYTVMVVVSDKDLGSDSATAAEFIVVFDPSGGFVTGGGWIDSPAGAYKDDETLKGKANFGFVAKYKKGANVPDGNTQFQFKAGDLNFHSSSYEWLVVAGNKAQFKGEGTINGEGSYMFKISADDDNPDAFRIHIWGDSGTVYDNGSQQELGGGSIKVHSK